jgi:hemerythrin-like domain-containing protein
MYNSNGRRSFLKQTALAVGSAAAAGIVAVGQEKGTNRGPKKEMEEVTPIEDLAREHGLLNRVLLIYDDFNSRLLSKKDLNLALLMNSAVIIQRFIEDYHEKLEEDYLFPRFTKAGKLTDLVAILRQQHNAGRNLTSRILQLTKSDSVKNSAERKSLESAISAFVRMYRPHEAREDTIIFPALRSIFSNNEYDSLGEEFEKKEYQLFGSEGFEGILDQVAGIEKKLGMYDLGQFTPR